MSFMPSRVVALSLNVREIYWCLANMQQRHLLDAGVINWELPAKLHPYNVSELMLDAVKQVPTADVYAKVAVKLPRLSRITVPPAVVKSFGWESMCEAALFTALLNRHHQQQQHHQQHHHQQQHLQHQQQQQLPPQLLAFSLYNLLKPLGLWLNGVALPCAEPLRHQLRRVPTDPAETAANSSSTPPAAAAAATTTAAAMVTHQRFQSPIAAQLSQWSVSDRVVEAVCGADRVMAAQRELMARCVLLAVATPTLMTSSALNNNSSSSSRGISSAATTTVAAAAAVGDGSVCAPRV